MAFSAVNPEEKLSELWRAKSAEQNRQSGSPGAYVFWFIARTVDVDDIAFHDWRVQADGPADLSSGSALLIDKHGWVTRLQFTGVPAAAGYTGDSYGSIVAEVENALDARATWTVPNLDPDHAGHLVPAAITLHLGSGPVALPLAEVRSPNLDYWSDLQNALRRVAA